MITEDAKDPDVQFPLYPGTADKTLDVIPGSGHMLMLERTAPAFRDRLSAWLAAHGF